MEVPDACYDDGLFFFPRLHQCRSPTSLPKANLGTKKKCSLGVRRKKMQEKQRNPDDFGLRRVKELRRSEFFSANM